MIPGTVQVTAQIAPTDPTDTYPTHDAVYGKGGLTHAATLVARDAIPAARRRPFMLCSVDADGLVYQLQADLTTWILFASAGGGSGTTYLASYGDSTPAIIFDLLSGQAINAIDVSVTEAWNGTGASIQIGVVGEPDRYYAALDTELTSIASFSKDFAELGPKQIILTITPGSTPTTGKVRIQVSTTLAGT
jgi:hypothetical protein